MKQTAFLVIILGALVAPQAARADTKEEARKHYDRAIELVDDGQLEGAIVEFQRSYDLTHHFAVLYNIGQVFVSLARPVEAVDVYERYLVGGGKSIPAARRAEVEQEIARQKARIATLEIRGLPEGAAVRLDGKEIGKAPIAAPVRVGVGTHAIAASAEGYDPAEIEVTVAGEDQRVVELVLAKHVVETPPPPAVAPSVEMPPPPVAPTAPPAMTPAASAPVVISTPVEPPQKQQSVSNMRIAGIASSTAGVAGMVAGSVCWALAKSRHDDAVGYASQNYARAQQLQGDAQDYATAGNTVFIVGGALAALGVVLYFVGVPSGQAVTPDTHVHLMPALGPSFAGLNAGGTW
ncbi:MAG: PEGA domain-containing protein [Polyangia bacterium]